jgi:ankyrin repeat protein
MWYEAKLPELMNFGYRLHLFDNPIVHLEEFASFETPLRRRAPGVAAPFIDVNDLGGAAKMVLHVCARVERNWRDPSFQPHIVALNVPTKNGLRTSINKTASWGSMVSLLTRFVCVFVTLVLPSRWGLHHPRAQALLERLATSGRAATLGLLVMLLAVGSMGCERRVDLIAALDLGDEVFATALAQASDADVERKRDGRTPLLHAAMLGRPRAIRSILARGASRTSHDDLGARALHIAAAGGHLEATQALLHAGFPLSEPDARTGKLPLHWAVTRGSPEVVDLLLRRGADVNARDNYGETPLHALARLDPWRTAIMAPRLVAAGADLEARDVRGFTPLHVAAGADNLGVVQLYASLPHTYDAATPTGLLPLDLAYRSRSDRVAERLFALGAHSKGAFVPPLHEAARGDDVERAERLLASGGDATRTFEGKTALDWAREHKSANVERVLVEYLEHPAR